MKDIAATILILLILSISTAYLMNHYSKVNVKFNMNNYMPQEDIKIVTTNTDKKYNVQQIYTKINKSVSQCYYNMDIIGTIIEKFQIKKNTKIVNLIKLSDKQKDNIIISYNNTIPNIIFINLFYTNDYINKKRMQIKCDVGDEFIKEFNK